MANLAELLLEAEAKADHSLSLARKLRQSSADYSLVAIAHEIRALRIVLGGLMMTLAKEENHD